MRQTEPTTTSIVQAAVEARRGQMFTSRSIAFATNLPLPVVSALLRRLADRGLIATAGLGPQMARGGLRATLWTTTDSAPTR
jgi:DNA-binding IscR family transcriptional regulator